MYKDKRVYIGLLYLLIGLLSWNACNPSNPEQPQEKKPIPVPTPTVEQKSIQTRQSSKREKPECDVKGELLEGTSIWLPQSDRLFHLVADSSTFDMDFGQSHRILLVQEGQGCKTLLMETLPVNFSPDYPYLLDTLSNGKDLNLVCAQGFEFIYCYDLNQDKLLPRMQPVYDEQIEALDAQSGSPMGLRLHERYLIGYGADMGGYVIDLNNDQDPKPLLPIYYYVADNGIPRSLFQLQGIDGHYELCVPIVDEKSMQFSVVPMGKPSDQPYKVVSKGNKGDKLLVSTNDQSITIDMNLVSSSE